MITRIHILADAEKVLFIIPSQSRIHTIPAYVAQNTVSRVIIALGEEAQDLQQGKEPLKTNTEQWIQGAFYITRPFHAETLDAPLIVAFIRYYLLRSSYDVRNSPVTRFIFSPFDRYECNFSLNTIVGSEDNTQRLIQEFKNQYALLSMKRLQINEKQIW